MPRSPRSGPGSLALFILFFFFFYHTVFAFEPYRPPEDPAHPELNPDPDGAPPLPPNGQSPKPPQAPAPFSGTYHHLHSTDSRSDIG